MTYFCYVFHQIIFKAFLIRGHVTYNFDSVQFQTSKWDWTMTDAQLVSNFWTNFTAFPKLYFRLFDVGADTPIMTMMVMQWGQFTSHDVSFTPMARGFNNTMIKCCNKDGNIVIFLHLIQSTYVSGRSMPLPNSK